MWHCPHCGAPQAESARCWVCRKSSTTCSTCRHFQVSLTSDVGWCGLDPKRRPLRGVEQRGCWQERPATSLASAPPSEPWLGTGRPSPQPPGDQTDEPPVPAPLDFIPVELVGRVVIPSEPAPPAGHAGEAGPPAMRITPEADAGWTERTSLFGDPEA
jgi:hypothetical protein